MQPEQVLLIIGAATYGVSILSTFTSHKSPKTYYALLGCAFTLLALALRWHTTGRAPWAALYETAALFALTTGAVGAATSRKARLSLPCALLAGVSGLLLLFSAISWEACPSLPAALDSPWLLIHVPMAMLAYGLFTTSASAAAAYIYFNARGAADAAVLAGLDRLSSAAAFAGLALLAAGIVLGAIWADAAWGAYWSWDPKETWALITAGIYALYLVLRLRGARGEDSAYISLLGFLSTIFTYLGVSYLIPGLHSYV